MDRTVLVTGAAGRIGSYFARHHGQSAYRLRLMVRGHEDGIGSFQPLERAQSKKSLSIMDPFVSERDLTQLLIRCIDAEDVRFATVHGLSGNRFNRLDISDARTRFGYDPLDDFTEHSPLLKDPNLPETLQTHSLKDYPQKSGLRKNL